MTDLLNPSIAPAYGAVAEEEWDVMTASTETGPGQRRILRTIPRWLVSQEWTCDPARAALLRAFWRLEKGLFSSFYFYTPEPFQRWPGVSAGTGTGSQLIFPFSGYMVNKTLFPPAVTVAAVAKTQGIDYEVGVENRIVYSEDFSQAAVWIVAGGSTVTRTGGQADPLGGTTAWRIQTSGGSALLKFAQSISGTPVNGQVACMSMWMKNTGAKAVTVADNMGAGVVIASGASSWLPVSFQSVGNGSYTPTLCFSAPTIGDSLDFLIWHPLYIWSNAIFYNPMSGWGYIPTVAAAILADTTLGKENLVFYASKAPGAGAANLIDFTGKRLLLGSLLARPAWSYVSYFKSTCSAQLSGEEV